MIHVLLTMANNSSTPYFNRFAERIHQYHDLKFSFVCLYPEKPKMLEDMQQRKCDCYWIPFNDKTRKKSYLTALVHLVRLFKKIKPDIVHTHLFDDSLPALLAAKLARVKYRIISKLDTGYHYNYRPYMMKFDTFNNWNATHIVSVSKENVNFLVEKENVIKQKITLIHQGIPFDEISYYSPSLTNQLINQYNLQRKKIILAVARYMELKGYKNIIEAAEILIHNKKRKDLLFLCFGYGEMKQELQLLTTEKKLEKYISFNDWIDREKLNCLYTIADIFIHASHFEPFGFVIAEAMATGIPVVATSTGAAADVMQHKVNGYLVNTNNSEELAEGIEYFLDNNTDAIRKNAKSTAYNYFSIETMLRKHVELYQNIFNKTIA